MGYYMVQVAYPSEQWKKMVENPAIGICEMTVRPVVERLRGKYLNGFVSFGEYDSVVIYEIDGNIGAATVAAALSAQGIFKAVKTTPLLPIQEGRQALKNAQQ